jgi:hypothetical protein
MDHYSQIAQHSNHHLGPVDGFTPELRINKQLAPLVFETLKINQPFPTKAEAARFALEVAKRWIDDCKPIPHKHGSK